MMEKVEELGAINKLILPFMKKGVLSNNYIMPGKYQNYIENGSLYYIITETALIFFIDCGNYRRVYYHIKDITAGIELPKDKPLVMELVYKSGEDSWKRQLEYWEAKGFKPYIHRLRMNCDSRALRSMEQVLQNVTYAESSQADIIHSMISEAFDPYLGCVPSVAEVEHYIGQKEIIIVSDEAGEVMGILHIGNKASTYFIWHLLVHPDARNKGVAKRLMAQLGLLLQEMDKAKIQLWVKSDNSSARSLYEKSGFEYDGWESAGLILNIDGGF